MATLRPSTRPASFDALRQSLWMNRTSYRVYRDQVAGILAPTELSKGAISPVVGSMMEDIARVKTIMRNPPEIDLVTEIKERPAMKLAHIPPGSHMLVIFQGGNDETNVKHFNDELLGPEVTNVLIAMRDEVIDAGLKFFELADDVTCVSSDHKTCHYYINDTHVKKALSKLQETLPVEAFTVTTSTSAIGSPQSLEVISYVMKHIEKDIQEAARRILEAKIAALLDTEDNLDQIKKIRYWLESQLRNIKLDFGLSEEVNTVLGGKEALKDRFWADQQATWSARKADSAAEKGKSFDIFTFVDDIQTIRQETLADEDLLEFFEPATIDGETYQLLKKEVIHNLRKWALVKKQYASDKAMMTKYDKLRRYYQAINGIDYITPWVDIESAHDSISYFEDITTSPDNIEELQKVLLMDQRNNKDCSAEYFHYQGTEFNSAYYISFDAIGIGDVNARDIELTALKAIKHLNTHRSTKSTTALKTDLQTIIMSVGQKVSIQIRETFDAARAEIENALTNVSIYTTRGGDEWHVLIGDPAHLDPNLVFDTIARIAQKYKLRATISYKEITQTDPSTLRVISDTERINAHYQALDLNEQNNAKIKAFEKAGLDDVVAIPGEDYHTAAKLPYRGKFKEISNIASIAGAIELAKQRDLPINPDTIIGILVGAAT